eukprot:6181810-Pleurochrysis_carterae.AAC.2
MSISSAVTNASVLVATQTIVAAVITASTFELRSVSGSGSSVCQTGWVIRPEAAGVRPVRLARRSVPNASRIVLRAGCAIGPGGAAGVRPVRLARRSVPDASRIVLRAGCAT